MGHDLMSGVHIQLPPAGLRFDGGNFFEFCQINRDYRIERNATGKISIMPPTGGETGCRNSRINRVLGNWAEADGHGEVFDSSTGFDLPNGANRSPDASWVLRSRLAQLTAEQKQVFLPLAPDFVIELASPSDRVKDLHEKMREYMDNGVRLGWLIIPQTRRVFVYQPDTEPVCLENPQQLDGQNVLPGLVMDLQPVWEPGF